MSIKVMSWVFENGPADPSERLVLLSLADYAADNGEWSPSMAGIAQKAGMTERGARGIIRRLEQGGWIAVKVGGGRGGRSQYRVLMARKNPEQETRNDKPGMTNPEYGDAKPGTKRPETRNGGSAEPSGTIIEPSDITPSPSGQGDMFAKTAKRNDQPERVVSQPDPDFDEFWSAFPPGRKTDKRQALETFRRIVAGKHKSIPKTDPQAIIAGARRFAASNPDPQFTPIPTTWLNRERWVSDDPVPAAVKRVSDFRPGGVIR